MSKMAGFLHCDVFIAEEGHETALDIFLKTGVDIKPRDDHGNTALGVFVECGHVGVHGSLGKK